MPAPLRPMMPTTSPRRWNPSPRKPRFAGPPRHRFRQGGAQVVRDQVGGGGQEAAAAGGGVEPVTGGAQPSEARGEGGFVQAEPGGGQTIGRRGGAQGAQQAAVDLLGSSHG